jgi:uncharacterized membrane protein
MKNFLQGNWLGHPLHSAVAHLPLALWTTALVFDLLSLGGNGNNVFVQTSFYAILVGLLSTLVVIPTGLAEWVDIKPDWPAWRLSVWHLGLNAVASLLWLANLGLRFSTFQTAASVSGLPLVLSILATGLVLAAGYLGGRMVYEHGVAVVRAVADKKWRPIAERGGARLPEPKE